MIYIVRHGETDWNVKKIYQGTKDIELNEVGIKQAEELKDQLKEINFYAVISSPLKRAYETAKIITGSENIKTDARLVERGGGDLEGRPVEEAFRLVDFNSPSEHRYNIENIIDFKKRVIDFSEEIKEKYRDKDILIVTHAGVCIFMRYSFEGAPENNDYSKYRIGNCKVLKYSNNYK